MAVPASPHPLDTQLKWGSSSSALLPLQQSKANEWLHAETKEKRKIAK
jgi:hypothetical protein